MELNSPQLQRCSCLALQNISGQIRIIHSPGLRPYKGMIPHTNHHLWGFGRSEVVIICPKYFLCCQSCCWLEPTPGYKTRQRFAAVEKNDLLSRVKDMISTIIDTSKHALGGLGVPHSVEPNLGLWKMQNHPEGRVKQRP